MKSLFLVATLLLGLSLTGRGQGNDWRTWGDEIWRNTPMPVVHDTGGTGNIVITIDSFFARQRGDGTTMTQYNYHVHKVITFYKAPLSYAKEEIDIKYAKRDLSKDSASIAAYSIVLPLIENEFRKHYKDWLPLPLDHWETTAETPPTSTISYKRKGDSAVLTQESYITRETNYLGRHLKSIYTWTRTKNYDRKNKVLHIQEVISNMKLYFVDTAHNDVLISLSNTNSALANSILSLTYLKARDSALEMKITPHVQKDSTASALILDQKTSIFFARRNDVRRKAQELYWRHIYRPRWTLGLYYTPAFAYRANFIEDQSFTRTADQQARSKTEEGRYGQAFEVQIGTSGLRHSWHLGLLYLQTGFAQSGDSNSSGINWNTGLPEAGRAANGLRRNGYGFSIGYNYLGYNRHSRISGAFDGSLYYLYNDQGGDGLRWNQWGVKVAAGGAWRPNPMWAIHVMPTMFYDLSSINTGNVLRSHLFNLGLTVGVTKRFMRPIIK